MEYGKEMEYTNALRVGNDDANVRRMMGICIEGEQ